MWKPFKCRLFGEHDYGMCRAPRALFLECRRCGHRSSGWVLPQEKLKRGESGFRLFMDPSDPGRTTPPNTNAVPPVVRSHAHGLRLTLAPPA